MDTCTGCGFIYDALDRLELVPSIGTLERQLASRLGGAGADAARRAKPDVWSALEYGCHVRDVLLIQRDRLFVALVEDTPTFTPMYRDQRVAFDRYAEQDPEVVAAQLLMAAAMAAHGFAGLSDAEWIRPLVYNFPEPTLRDVEWMARHTVHEMAHHQADLERQLAGQ